ncbi:type II toxin-antitoxin system RelE/ParE family toxin (plasmid) [Roseibium aggregatum]|uniref:type II toxin-antitoxin system RelE/ParE family toxin n=1 Tax=Roseibium aggregatum TaxID=187304 RepID=UPI001E43193C|nr:type II toxin-antitoxin system RelE/ParE family toxin [Roseibium aggregatum]UES59930.1 type II toxin-antitoxin system RelE/ParE family toxin [Roseibium aggregatum]
MACLWTLEYSRAAERDFELIFDLLFVTFFDLGEDRAVAFERAAERIRSIRSAIDRLTETPFIGTLRPEIMPNLRFVRCDQAAVRLLADSSDNKIFVAAIFFGAQDHIRKMLIRLLSD